MSEDKSTDLSQYAIGAGIGIVIIVLLMVFTLYINDRNNPRDKLRTIVEDTYCLPHTTLQDFGTNYINCCRIYATDPEVQNYIRYNMTVNIIQCYQALAEVN